MERFSPGQNGPKVGCPVRLFKVICLPTLDPIGPGENLLNQPEIARTVRILPKKIVMIEAGNPENFRAPESTTCAELVNMCTLLGFTLINGNIS